MTVIRDEYQTWTELLEPYEEANPICYVMTAIVVSGGPNVLWHCLDCRVPDFTTSLVIRPALHSGHRVHVENWLSLIDVPQLTTTT